VNSAGIVNRDADETASTPASTPAAESLRGTGKALLARADR